MRLVLDACVIYPNVLRGLLIGAAKAGFYTPLFSARILEEWVRATHKLGPQAEASARIDAALLSADFPRSVIPAHPAIEARHILPDPNDLHVLATAIAGQADAIVTFNAKDFPRHVLHDEGIARRDPDGLLWAFHSADPERLMPVITQTHHQACALAGREISQRGMLKRLRLNRLAKALDGP